MPADRHADCPPVDVSLSKIGFGAATDAHTESLQVAIKMPSLTCLRVRELIDAALRDLDGGHI